MLNTRPQDEVLPLTDDEIEELLNVSQDAANKARMSLDGYAASGTWSCDVRLRPLPSDMADLVMAYGGLGRSQNRRIMFGPGGDPACGWVAYPREIVAVIEDKRTKNVGR